MLKIDVNQHISWSVDCDRVPRTYVSGYSSDPLQMPTHADVFHLTSWTGFVTGYVNTWSWCSAPPPIIYLVALTAITLLVYEMGKYVW